MFSIVEPVYSDILGLTMHVFRDMNSLLCETLKNVIANVSGLTLIATKEQNNRKWSQFFLVLIDVLVHLTSDCD